MVLADAEDDEGIGSLGHPSISRDEEYYFSESADLLVFQVEDRLFRVHIPFLEKLESAVFQDMLSLGPSRSDKTSKDAEGGSDLTPIVIPQVTAFEFKTLLDFLYKPMAMHPFTQEQWIALLSLKKRFQIPIEPKFAVREFSEAEPRPSDAKILEVVDNFDIPMDLIKPVLVRLIMGSQGEVTAGDIARISPETIMMYFNAREKFRDILKNRGRQDEADCIAANIIGDIFSPKRSQVKRRISA